jgi:ATP-dependent Clp protease adaptor protein ClpS
MMPLEEKDAQLEEIVISGREKELVVFNDDFNTFDHVIETLVKVCKHSAEQAEQCTWIIHHNGQCSVKVGDIKSLKPMRDGICDRGIDAEVL